MDIDNDTINDVLQLLAGVQEQAPRLRHDARDMADKLARLRDDARPGRSLEGLPALRSAMVTERPGLALVEPARPVETAVAPGVRAYIPPASQPRSFEDAITEDDDAAPLGLACTIKIGDGHPFTMDFATVPAVDDTIEMRLRTDHAISVGMVRRRRWSLDGPVLEVVVIDGPDLDGGAF